MVDPIKETKKRLSLAEKETDKFRKISLGVILSGSVAYAPNLHVTETSDIDLLIIVEDIKESLELILDNEKTPLRNRFFEGYCIKKDHKGIPLSVHILSNDSFDIISKCFVADIRVYRKGPKIGSYCLRSFEGNEYDYKIKNIDLPDLQGVRTIVPISFINKDRYFIGIHRDKLLCSPRIMYERNCYVSEKIDKLWDTVVRNLYDEAMRLYEKLDLSRMNVLNALVKKDKLDPDATKNIIDKTSFYLSHIK